MLKIDYILLARHFRGETLEEENLKVVAWQNENVINKLTFNRLKKTYQSNCPSVDEQKITKEETKAWKKIITKILEEGTEE